MQRCLIAALFIRCINNSSPRVKRLVRNLYNEQRSPVSRSDDLPFTFFIHTYLISRVVAECKCNDAMLPPKPMFVAAFLSNHTNPPTFSKSILAFVGIFQYAILTTYVKKIRCFHDKILYMFDSFISSDLFGDAFDVSIINTQISVNGNINNHIETRKSTSEIFFFELSHDNTMSRIIFPRHCPLTVLRDVSVSSLRRV